MTFQVIKTTQIPEQSIKWLEGTLARTPLNIETAESIVAACNNEVYLIIDGDKIYGSIFMFLFEAGGKRFLNILAIGGIELSGWSKLFRKYIRDLLDQEKADLWIMTGSKAWARIFGLKTVGYIYTM